MISPYSYPLLTSSLPLCVLPLTLFFFFFLPLSTAIFLMVPVESLGLSWCAMVNSAFGGCGVWRTQGWRHTPFLRCEQREEWLQRTRCTNLHRRTIPGRFVQELLSQRKCGPFIFRFLLLFRLLQHFTNFSYTLWDKKGEVMWMTFWDPPMEEVTPMGAVVQDLVVKRFFETLFTKK